MKKFDFKDLVLIDIVDVYVVTYNGQIITIDGKTTFSSINKAKNNIQKVLTANYIQGHYWHKGKANTFCDEGGQMRNNGIMNGLDKIFKKLGAELTNELLDNSIFIIKKL